MDARNLIAGLVGQGGANEAIDVRIVQRLLNEWLANTGQSQLKVDGLVGPKTLSAITAFQKKNTLSLDGRLGVGGPTINALFNQHLAGLLTSIDFSRFSGYSAGTGVKNTSLSDPIIAPLIQQYISALRKSA
jgi:peptidoglycan hydrolase-like protein with peptidoglycan-binding domain